MALSSSNENFKIDLTLLIVTSSTGLISIFNLLSDSELFQQIFKNKEQNAGQWLWKKLEPVMPANFIMFGPSIKIDLKTIERKLDPKCDPSLIKEIREKNLLLV